MTRPLPGDPRAPTLWPASTRPRVTADWWRALGPDGTTGARQQQLTLAALEAAAIARTQGSAWILANDGTSTYLHDNQLHPDTGWAATAARIIERTRTP